MCQFRWYETAKACLQTGYIDKYFGPSFFPDTLRDRFAGTKRSLHEQITIILTLQRRDNALPYYIFTFEPHDIDTGR